MKNVKRIESAGNEDGVDGLDPELDEIIDDLGLDEDL